MPETRQVPTPTGPARVVRFRPRRTLCHLVLTHGAGGGIDATDLGALAEGLPRHGIAVTLVEQPWRVAGRRVAPRPAVIDECYLAVVRGLRSRGPMVIGGRSAGARSACRIAAAVGAPGVLALAFPLHPPGRPEKSRVAELTGAGATTLVVQGERDPFGTPAEFPDATELAVIPGADHALRVPARGPVSADDALVMIREAVLEWLVREVAGNLRA